MPETPFTVQLPSGEQEVCYSPSSVVKEYFKVGETLTVEAFLAQADKALTEASNRVQAKFGFACSGATNSLATIRRWSAPLKPTDHIKIIHI